MSQSPYRALTLAAFTVAAASFLALGGCGAPKSEPAPTGPSSTELDSGFVEPDSGSTVEDSGTQTDAGADAGADAGPSVLCGTTTCAKGQTCCFLGADGGSIAECRASCPSGNSVACDGPEDCAGSASPLCCFSGSLKSLAGQCFPSQVKSECKSTCDLKLPGMTCTGTAQGTVCRAKSDCAGNGAYVHCCPLSFNGASVGTVCSDKADTDCLP